MRTERFVGFEFQAIWFDDDAIQLRMGWNGAFGGTVSVYEGIGDLELAAEKLRGFPQNPSDKRELIFGSFGRNFAGGGLKMSFYCIGGAGHAYVEATFEAGDETAGTIQRALLSMHLEAAAVDTFVEELRAIGVKRAGRALMAGHVIQLRGGSYRKKSGDSRRNTRVPWNASGDPNAIRLSGRRRNTRRLSGGLSYRLARISRRRARRSEAPLARTPLNAHSHRRMY
jgi:hypothetical protein